MHSFIVKIKEGEISPLSSSKKQLLEKLLAEYEHRDITLKLSLEIVEKNLSQAQVKMYKAFILKAGDHFGSDYTEMQNILKRFYPDEDLPVERWSTKQLDTFINRSTAFLADHGFHF